MKPNLQLYLGGKTDFSLGESIIDPLGLVHFVGEGQYKALAVADTMNINSLSTLFKECQKREMKAIIGASIKVVDDVTKRAEKGTKYVNPYFMAKLFVRNEDGLRDLMNLLTLGNTEERFYRTAQVSLDDLLATCRKRNVVCTSGDAHSIYSHKDYKRILEQVIEAVGSENFFTELPVVCLPYYERIGELAVAWETENRGASARLLVSVPSLHPEGMSQHRDTLNAITRRLSMSSIFRQEVDPTLTPMPAERLTEATEKYLQTILPRIGIASLPASLFESSETAFLDLIDYKWEKMPISLPEMAANPTAALAELCVEGWKTRITQEVLGYRPPKEQLQTYRERLKYELHTLRRMKFENYFLFVRDLVIWSKREGIMVGPGRGSVGGSLVAYLLGITEVDPIRFGLVFERFINPERLDLPDIDLDFMSSRREEVIKYLIDKYGEEHVAGIANYASLVSSSSLRAVASAFDLKPTEFACSKLVPKEQGTPHALEDAAVAVPEIQRFAEAYPDVWRIACGLQNVFRNYGKHAAGVIVAADKISERAVVSSRDDRVVNWDMRVVEDFGLVKLDVLGLQTLDLLRHAVDMVQERTGKAMNLLSLPLDDKAVLDGFGKGKTIGVFQFESSGMRHLLKELAFAEPLSFNEIVAATALFRPGPLESGLTESYVQIRQGASLPTYPHPSMRNALEETYSVLVFQEQVMQIARDLAGFTMAEADKLRKAMGKKNAAEMAAMREKFASGCESSVGREKGEQLFDQIEKFAGYAFNKSHSVEYAILSYWSMYLKTHHPAEFFAAALGILSEEKRPALVKDAESYGLVIMPPDINISSDRFVIREEGGKTLLYAPFYLVKGVSEEKGLEAIMKAKQALGRPFRSKEEFLSVVNKRICNVRVQEALEKVGAFWSTDGGPEPLSRERLRDQKGLLPGLMSAAVAVRREKPDTSTMLTELEAIYRDVAAAGATLERKITEDRRRLDPYAPEKTCVHPMPYIGRHARVFILLEQPNFHEVKEQKMGKGDASQALMTAIKRAGINMTDCYITALVKCGKDKGEQINNDMINAYSDFVLRELDLINPPIIVSMGGKATRFLTPDAEGGWEELAGQTAYDAARDATVVYGFNPGMIYFNPQRQELLDSIFMQVKELLSA